MSNRIIRAKHIEGYDRYEAYIYKRFKDGDVLTVIYPDKPPEKILVYELGYGYNHYTCQTCPFKCIIRLKNGARAGCSLERIGRDGLHRAPCLWDTRTGVLNYKLIKIDSLLEEV